MLLDLLCRHRSLIDISQKTSEYHITFSHRSIFDFDVALFDHAYFLACRRCLLDVAVFVAYIEYELDSVSCLEFFYSSCIYDA